MKEYISPEAQFIDIVADEVFSAYGGCIGETWFAEGLGNPVCSAQTPDSKGGTFDGSCWLTPSA